MVLVVVPDAKLGAGVVLLALAWRLIRVYPLANIPAVFLGRAARDQEGTIREQRRAGEVDGVRRRELHRARCGCHLTFLHFFVSVARCGRHLV